ncbi:hypothetical protein Pmani_006155 [Petrolisthes manimaculis]|uniref:Uncharacterized protein n=1 Tax=Petrolisthes manimaculis TaxID=1843537 RepID=A0AAE1UJV1_9EUCA|nr:hypothetical protein Pmani_006155 [Petrolisthes manimaculis]
MPTSINSGKMRSPHLTVFSANVRGLPTNKGDLTHNFILSHQTDIAVVTNTWLTSEVESTFDKSQDTPTGLERTNIEDREVVWQSALRRVKPG